MIRFLTEVQRIRQSGEGVTIDVVTDGQRATMTADWCIFTEINYRLGFEVVRFTLCVATLVKQRLRQGQSGGSQADISTTICLATPHTRWACCAPRVAAPNLRSGQVRAGGALRAHRVIDGKRPTRFARHCT